METRDCNLCFISNCPSRDLSDKHDCLIEAHNTINMDAYTEDPVLRFREGRLFTQRCKVNQLPEDVDVTEAVAKAIAKYIKN